MPLLDAVRLRPGKRGRPRKRPKVIATAKEYEAKDLRRPLRRRGIRFQMPKRVWKTKTPRGRPLKIDMPRFQAERTFAWFQQKDHRLVVRWERRAACFAAFLAIATIHIWLQRLIVGYIHENTRMLWFGHTLGKSAFHWRVSAMDAKEGSLPTTLGYIWKLCPT
jgi:hypothetical protein